MTTASNPIQPSTLIPILLGILAAAASALIAGNDVPPKFILALFIGLTGLAGWLVLVRTGLSESVLILGLALSIPINPTKNFLIQPHVGGAPGLQIQAAGLVMFFLYAAIIVRMLARRPINWRIDPAISFGIVAYIAVGALSLSVAFYPAFTIFELIRLTQMFFAFMLVSQFRDERRINLFLAGLALGAIFEACLAAYQYKTGSHLGLAILGEDAIVKQNIGFNASRATGTIGHPNQLAYFFEILIPVFLAAAISYRNTALRLLFLLAFAAACAGILTTLSRAGWLTVPLTTLIVLISTVGWRVFSPRGGVVVVVIGAAVLIAAALAYPTIEKRFTHNDYQSAESRQPLNAAAFSIIKAHPVLGVGLNNFAEIFHQEDTTGYARIFRGVAGPNFQVLHYKQVVHNLYLQVWAEVGTIGLLAFLGQFVLAFASLIWRPRNADPRWRALRIAICAGIFAQLFHGLFDPGFKTTFNISLQVYCLLGLLSALNLGVQPSLPTTPPPAQAG